MLAQGPESAQTRADPLPAGRYVAPTIAEIYFFTELRRSLGEQEAVSWIRKTHEGRRTRASSPVRSRPLSAAGSASSGYTSTSSSYASSHSVRLRALTCSVHGHGGKGQRGRVSTEDDLAVHAASEFSRRSLDGMPQGEESEVFDMQSTFKRMRSLSFTLDDERYVQTGLLYTDAAHLVLDEHGGSPRCCFG